MGIKLLSSDSSSFPEEIDFRQYEIVKSYRANNYNALWVNYYNATNYEGNKILVFKGPEPKKLDPHFFESSNLVMRIIPTENAWDSLIWMLNQGYIIF